MDKKFTLNCQSYNDMSLNIVSQNDCQTEKTFYSSQQNIYNNQSELMNKEYMKSFKNTYENSITYENKNKRLESKNNIQEIQNIENVELGNFDETGYCTYRKTKRKGKRDEIKLNHLEQQYKQYEDICINIYKNEQSIVDLKFDSNIMNFIIKKQNLSETELFEKEYKKLELLKGLNITLDIVSTMKDHCTFQQIAGKTNLEMIKQRNKSKQIFYNFYFILYDKLKKMHEQGIAHSDIKPQNIVISFNNEPFFIDFGGSIYLSDESDHKNYLNFFTPNFNLKIYFDIFKQQDNKYKPIMFKSKEQIKLCDMVQLSLSFLDLIYDNDVQKKLFLTKQYNQLFQNIIHQNHEDKFALKQKKIFLFHISKILNQADPKIKIIEEGKGNIFEINQKIRKNELRELNDIIFKDSEKFYMVQRIDKFSIKFIFYLYQLDYKLQINPRNAYITPLLDMEEYNLINKKYKIIEQIQELINNIDFNRNEKKNQMFNICQYIKAYQIRNIDISASIGNYQWIMEFFQRLNNLELLYPLEFKFKFMKNELLEIITLLRDKNSNFCVKNFEIFADEIKVKIIIDENKNIQINKKTELNFVNVVFLTQFFYYSFKEQQNLIQKYYKIKQLEICFLHQQTNCYLQSKQFQNRQLNKQNNSYETKKQQYYFDCQYSQILNRYQIFEDKPYSKKIKIKVYDQIFILKNIWLKIKNFLESNSICYVEIIAVNCFFRQSIVEFLKQIYQQYDNKVKYEFKDEFIEQIENNDIKFNFKFELSNEQFQEQGLKIIFLNQIPLKDQQNDEAIKNIQQIQNQQKLETMEECFNSHKFSDYQDKEHIQSMFQDDQFNNNTFLKKLKIEYEQQIYIQRFRFIHRKIVIDWRNDTDLLVKEIDQIIKNIQYKIHYYNIVCFGQNGKQCYEFFDVFQHLKIKCNSENINQFNSLNLAISNIYNFHKRLLNLYKIIQEIEYQYFYIIQEMYYKKLNNKFQSIFNFFEQNISQNTDNKKNTIFLFLKNSIINIKNSTELNLISKNLMDCNNHFQQYSIINLQLSNVNIKNKSKLFVFEISINFLDEKDNYFKIFFYDIEKIFPQNKVYQINTKISYKATYGFFYTKDYNLILENIYETLKIYSFEQKLYFDLSILELQYDQIQQFIMKFNEVNINQFIFRINLSLYEIESQFLNDFQDYMDITKIDDSFLCLQKKEQIFNQKIAKRIQIELRCTMKRYTSQILDSDYNDQKINKSKIVDSTYKVYDLTDSEDCEDMKDSKFSMNFLDQEYSIESVYSSDLTYYTIDGRKKNYDFIELFGEEHQEQLDLQQEQIDLDKNKLVDQQRQQKIDQIPEIKFKYQYILDNQDIQEFIFPSNLSNLNFQGIINFPLIETDASDFNDYEEHDQIQTSNIQDKQGDNLHESEYENEEEEDEKDDDYFYTKNPQQKNNKYTKNCQSNKQKKQ